MLAEDYSSPCGCRPVLTGYGLAHAKPLDVAESPNIVRGAEIAHWSPERLIDADNTKVRVRSISRASPGSTKVQRAAHKACTALPAQWPCGLLQAGRAGASQS